MLFRSDRPLRFLVIGDSSAENVALALSNGSRGETGVVSGGVLGCPLMKVALVHRRIDEDQTTDYCPDNLALVSGHAADIDVLLVVASVANQWDYQPIGEDVRVAVGSTRYRSELDAFIDRLEEILAPYGVPVLVLESPRVRDDRMMNGDTAEPRAAWNSVMNEWDSRYRSVSVVPYDDLLADPDTADGRRQRPDGTHIEEDFGRTLARDRLIPRLRQVYFSTLAEMSTSGCLVDGRLDPPRCRVSP